MEIVKKSFITLWSLILLIGVFYMIFTGNEDFNIKLLLNAYEKASEDFNLYDKVVKAITGSNYSYLSQNQKQMYFTQFAMSNIKNLTLALNNLDNTQWYYNIIKTFSIFIEFFSSILGLGLMIIEVLFKVLNTAIIIGGTFYYLFGLMTPMVN